MKNKSITILYTKDKAKSIEDSFAIFSFVVYNKKDFEDVIKNIEEHFDGIVIECDEEMKGRDNTHYGKLRRGKRPRK